MYFFRPLLLSAFVGLVLARPQSSSSTPASASSNSCSPTITLDYTTLSPVAGNSSLGYYKYQNVRFAAVPTGSLRWAAPTWPPVETEVNSGSLASEYVACNSEEDCLYMDIWVPADIPEGTKLPVLVWTYGGGFTGGSKSQNTPEGLFGLSKGFIFVSYNYRLGITGLANGPTLLHGGGNSNTALWDVEHAFKWIRKYISEFGGDTEQVTAVGFSAGGSQTLFQLTRFAGHAEQLFNRAYVMSPGFVLGLDMNMPRSVFWQNVSTAVGCTGGSLSCMRDVNFTTLNTAANQIANTYTYQFQPRVDGDFVADTSQLYQNRFNFTGPLVITHEQHEVNSRAWSGVNTTEDVATYLRIFFPAMTDAVVEETLALYPEADYSSPGLRFSDMKQHFDLTAHNLAVTNTLGGKTWNAMVALGQASHGTDQSYYWYSNYTLSSSSGSTGSGNSTGSAGGASGGPPSGSTGGGTSGNSTGGGMSGGPGGGESVDSTIAVKMQKCLVSFVLTGNPNTKCADDKLFWPQYSNSTTGQYGNSTNAGTQLVFNTTFYTDVDDLATEKSLFWNKALWY